MKRRLALLACVALGVAPGTWLRETPTGNRDRAILNAEPLALPFARIGEVEVTGLWHLTSPNDEFGGYSALVVQADGSFLAISDRGRWLQFRPFGTDFRPSFGAFAGTGTQKKSTADAEAATTDPAGHIWVAFESTNSIERYRRGLVDPKKVEPAEMADWPRNSGPEAMTRLADGRFLIIGEGASNPSGSSFPGLMFDGDPVDGAKAIEFHYIPPTDFRATDMATLPDGRVLILMRKIVNYLPPRFATALAVIDPANIKEGESLSGDIIARFGTDIPSDNFEGLAVVPETGPDANGAVTLWMISDNNNASLQQTLLYRLRWQPTER